MSWESSTSDFGSGLCLLNSVESRSSTRRDRTSDRFQVGLVLFDANGV
jgi:hypothetical protein